ncbi:hypothetical protein D3C81_1538490 [compost metagenome]
MCHTGSPGGQRIQAYCHNVIRRPPNAAKCQALSISGSAVFLHTVPAVCQQLQLLAEGNHTAS